MNTREVEIDRPVQIFPAKTPGTVNPGGDFLDMVIEAIPNMKKTRRVRTTVAAARPILEQQETEKLISTELINEKAVQAAEHGVVFIDEIDKVRLKFVNLIFFRFATPMKPFCMAVGQALKEYNETCYP